MAQTSRKLILSASGSSTNLGSLNLVEDGLNGKDLQNAEMGEAPDDMSSCFVTLPQRFSPQEKFLQEEIPFEKIGKLRPTHSKLLCCDFSTPGQSIAAAGLEPWVFIWNPNKSVMDTFKGHSQLITDIRFRPDSTNFATSSHDRTVRIWDAVKRKSRFQLVGHSEHVMSLDYHPIKENLLCSCESNNEIILWNINQCAMFHAFKGANRLVRFQPRLGNLLAAATGNMINLIDVETSTIHYRFEGHAKNVCSMCWDISGKYLASVSEDSARIWSVVSGGKCVHELHSGGNEFASCTFHPVYSQVVAVGSNKSIDFWNPVVGKSTWTYQAHDGIVSALANSPKTKFIASVGHDRWIKLWK